MRRTRGLRAAMSAALLVTACTSNAPDSSSAPAAPASQTAASVASSPLAIGVLLPYTESAIDSDLGASQKRAADLYLKLHGGALGGRPVRLVYNDESSLDPAINLTRIQQFLDQDHVGLLMGGIGAPAAYQLRDAAVAAKIVYIDTSATANALTRAMPGCAPSCESPYVFRSSSTSWQLAEPLGEWASRSGQKRFFVVYDDDAFGVESVAAFADGLAKGGGLATGRSAVPEKGGGWAKVIAAIKAQSTKAVFAALFSDDAEGFLTAWDATGMRDAGYRLYGPGPLADAEVLKATKGAGLGVITTFDWSSELDNAENKSFVDEFKKAYNDEDTGQPLAPDGYALEMWDAMRALDAALAATKGETNDTGALIRALQGVALKTPGGDFSFDPSTHNPIEDVYVREVRPSGTMLVNAVIDTIRAVRDPGQ